MAMESFVAASAGLFLFYAWWQNRQRALLLWAINGLFVAIAIPCILVAVTNDARVLFAVSNVLLGGSAGLIWAAARVFTGRNAPAAIIALPAIFSPALAIVAGAAGYPAAAVGLPLFVGPVFLVLAARTFVLSRHEMLAARWPMVGLLGLHAALLVAGGISFVTGLSEPSLLGPIGTVFGLIHFESIVFAVGSAVFFLAMHKERSEAANKLAAQTDGLTGIANRQGFMAQAERLLKRSRASGQDFSVVMFDLDHFKAVNDTYGHSTGDEVIRGFVRVVRDGMRPGDVFGRLGGEEFAVAIAGASVDTAFVRADRIRMDFAKATFDFGGDPLTKTVSAGVASGTALALGDLLAEADAALYRAKAAGRNRVARAATGAVDADRRVLRIA